MSAVLLLAALLLVVVALYVVGRLLARPDRSIARGKTLDLFGLQLNVKRKRWESDAAYRKRINEALRGGWR